MAESDKHQQLLRLGDRRKATRRDGYKCLGDFHNGCFECDYVSPWTKGGKNVDAKVMIVGQDWASADMLERDPPDNQMAVLGFDQDLPTNKNLNELLERYFSLKRGECYLTNLFPFIKQGAASANIPMEDLVWSAREFTREEIRIVSPNLVICLGLRTFHALMRVANLRGSPRMEQAIATSFKLENAMVRCVAHTGAFGTNNRSRDRVEDDWRKLARSYPQVCRR